MSHAASPGSPATEVRFDDLVALRHGSLPRQRMAIPSVLRPGGFAGRRRGHGLDIHDVRHFVDGDDLRHADPAATARTGRLHVRTFHEERDRAALLVADFRRPMLWATRGRLRSVAGAAALAVLGWRIIDAGGKVGLLAVREGGLDHIAVRPRERTMMQVAGALEAGHARALAEAQAAAEGGPRIATAAPARGGLGPLLAAFGARPRPSDSSPAPAAPLGEARTQRHAPPEPLHAVLERAARLVPRGGAIVCATGLDTPGEGFEAVVGSIARRRRLVLLLVRDALETAPPARRLTYYGDDGLVLDGRIPAADDARVAVLRALGATVVPIGTHADGGADDLAALEIA
ncbi:DUF58 domain-containing protein [Acuticoccus sp. I52.16.1]|uniref:DUF58 domain-containing protein n=1 Tax=Acuticoccus sp. I52.16.1 TaxID=2928472 RepID=UPI001FD0C283|nr:DUF58 domain-containing protein [Acuticoccus sp. I52.16.1]UOM35567.1 DUF58 domain-containing protein [Acuticoccus sp. I52.16.1]